MDRSNHTWTEAQRAAQGAIYKADHLWTLAIRNYKSEKTQNRHRAQYYKAILAFNRIAPICPICQQRIDYRMDCECS